MRLQGQAKGGIWRWPAVVAWVGIVFGIGSANVIPLKNGDVLRLVVRKAIHVGEYAVLGTLLYHALARGARRFRPGVALLVLFLVVGFAGLDEWRQSFIPGRSGRLLDVVIDAVGAGIGQLLILVWCRVVLVSGAPRCYSVNNRPPRGGAPP